MSDYWWKLPLSTFIELRAALKYLYFAVATCIIGINDAESLMQKRHCETPKAAILMQIVSFVLSTKSTFSDDSMKNETSLNNKH